jgi:hypothetical protein
MFPIVRSGLSEHCYDMEDRVTRGLVRRQCQNELLGYSYGTGMPGLWRKQLFVPVDPMKDEIFGISKPSSNGFLSGEK